MSHYPKNLVGMGCWSSCKEFGENEFRLPDGFYKPVLNGLSHIGIEKVVILGS